MNEGHIVIGVITWVILCAAWTFLMVSTIKRVGSLERRVRELEDLFPDAFDKIEDVQP